MTVDLDTLRQWLKIASDDHDGDEILESLVPVAVAMVENASGYNYGDADLAVVEFVRGLGTNELFLVHNATDDPDEVREIPAVGDTGTVITAAQSDGWVRRGNRLLRKAGVWTRDYEYQVTFPAGYAPGTEPAEVRQAVISIVGVLYRSRGKEGLSSETIPDYTYAKNTDELKQILDALPHRPVFA